MAAEEICKWVEHLKSRSGVQIVRLIQHHHTDISSIQGIWHPFLNKDPSLAATTLPAPELYRVPRKQKSATEMLLDKASIRREEENVVKELGSVENISLKE
ncbi:hypothetical protein C0Q70_10399 [Pomacea canaliculata]|uniref:Ribosomal protein/NADH dehydrogenase domain-containing protein n=2 Tax=Pomacea canaliculata TaxID=400727 RepID=A0A2T7PCJ2_POMCA|nr:hypothetical protein C0Q70_10399 [Pomacea canaliculata]